MRQFLNVTARVFDATSAIAKQTVTIHLDSDELRRMKERMQCSSIHKIGAPEVTDPLID
jgi:hypothetical protein